MDVLSIFTDQQLEEMIVEAVQRVFSTMLSTEAKYLEKMSLPENVSGGIPSPIDSQESLVTGSVGFSGVVSGVIFLYMEESLSVKMTGRMLGMTEEEVKKNGHETVNDALGELTNMTVGSFKNKLCDAGYNCRLTIPSILRGKNFAVEPPGASIGKVLRRYFKFDVEGSSYVVDLLMKPQIEQ